ncbi:MAG: YciI family protein [Gammaproteobacteria bacterium]|nr:YciI family protein [Gammaproteobacteria bacterium]
MLYAVFAEDVPDSAALRAKGRQEHLRRLHELVEEGRLVLAGPHPAVDSPEPGPAGFSGSLIVAEFDSLVAAREWAEADPFAAAGAYARVTVKPFRQVLP